MKYRLINQVTIGTNPKLPGDLIDSLHEDVAAIASVGGVLVAADIPEVEKAAALATQLLQRGGDVLVATSLMVSAFLSAVSTGVGSELSSLTFDPEAAAPSYREGRVYFKDNSLNVMTEFSDVVIQVGEELQVQARNDDEVDILNGRAVYVQAAHGRKAAVKLASPSVDPGKVLGLATHDIAAGQDGRITTFGLVRGLDTHGMTVGQELFVTDAGALTTTQPGGDEVLIRIGIVFQVHASNGIVFVFPRVEERFSYATTDRPTDGLRAGRQIFDSTLGLPIWWTGTAWVKADGTSA